MTTHNGRGQDGIPGPSGDAEMPAGATPQEGVVLPANGAAWTSQQQVPSAQQQVQPPAGQPWGQPWGPGTDAGTHGGGVPMAPAAPPAAPDGRPPGPEGLGPEALGPEAFGPESSGPEPLGPGMPGQGPGTLGGPEPLGPGTMGGAEPLGPGTMGGAEPLGPGTMGGPTGALGASGGERASVAQPLPPEGAQAPLPPQGAPAQPMPQPGAPGMPGVPGAQLPAQPPMPPAQPSVPPGVPEPLGPGNPDSASEATQMIPPVGIPGAGVPGAEDGTQVLPPVPAMDEEATQYMPPVVDAQPESRAESTQKLRAVKKPASPQGQAQPQPQPQPLPGAEGGQGGGQGPGRRQPPAGFESLFRPEPSVRMGSPADGPGGGDPGSTQSLPIFEHAAEEFDDYEPQGRAARRSADRMSKGRMSQPGLLVACGVVGVAVIGLIVGATLSGGGSDDEGKSDKPKASTEPAADKQTTKPPDPVKGQAQKLDKLLNDSNNSRSTVVTSVARIRACKMLPKAASDLRGAAKQRNGLVTRLGELKTDKIPNGPQLTGALTRAWKSSASADAHYANWADQVARGKKKTCHKGHARSTPSAAAGNRASGSATAAKKQAASLWNPTAQKYSLTTRQFGDL